MYLRLHVKQTLYKLKKLSSHKMIDLNVKEQNTLIFVLSRLSFCKLLIKFANQT